MSDRGYLTVLVVVLLLSCVVAGNSNAGDRLWYYEAPYIIENYSLTPIGNLLITTPKAIVALDIETGAEQWRRDDLLPRKSGLTLLPLTPVGIVKDNNGITVIDLDTGKTRWDMSALPLKKTCGFVPVMQFSALLVFGESDKSDKSMLLVDLATGEVHWQQDSVLEKKPETECYDWSKHRIINCGRIMPQAQTMIRHQHPIIHGDGIVFYVSKDGLMKVDAKTGDLLWKVDRLKDKYPPMPGKSYPPFVVSDDVIFVPYEKKVMAIDLNSGAVVWDHDKNFRNEIRQMKLTDAGLVVLGFAVSEDWNQPYLPNNVKREIEPPKDYFMMCLDASNGTPKWEKPIKKLDIPLPFLVDEGYAFVARTKDVILVDLESGEFNQFAKLSFVDDEIPVQMEKVGDDLLVASAQNTVLLKPRGGTKYQKYYERPGFHWVQKMMLLGAGVFFDHVWDVGMNKLTSTTAGGTTTVIAGQFTISAIQSCSDRYGMTLEGDKYRYIYTGEPLGERQGKSLVKLNKATGEEEGRIWVNKTVPDYKIDLATGTIFVKELTDRIFAVR